MQKKDENSRKKEKATERNKLMEETTFVSNQI